MQKGPMQFSLVNPLTLIRTFATILAGQNLVETHLYAVQPRPLEVKEDEDSASLDLEKKLWLQMF